MAVVNLIDPAARATRAADFARLAALGLNGQQIAKRAGCSPTVVYQAMRYIGKPLKRKKYVRIAERLVSLCATQAAQSGTQAAQEA